MSNVNTNTCSQCGKPVVSGPLGTCPHCLMALAINESPTSSRPDSARGYTNHVPPIEQLVAQFPDLEIKHLIGHGGMGAVYQALQINLDRMVALKILSPSLSYDPAFAERFLREARTLAKLAHPNIVTIFDFGQAGEFYYLTMELVDGVNLRDTIAAETLNPAEALAIVPQVCDALQYAHDHGVVHRDIKPENIIISKKGNVKIADFGLAKILEPNAEQYTLTATRQIMGTRNYMAPEQIESPETVDHRADLYSLGVVFYELLTGELPLGRFALPSEKSPSVSGGLDDVVMRTLEKDPGQRYQQASQIKTACHSLDSAEEVKRPRNKENIAEPRATVCPQISVTLEGIYASLASAYGFLRAYEDDIELEFEVRDSVVDHRWASDKVLVPLDRIAWIKLHEGLMYSHIEVQANDFESVRDIPSSRQGIFRVYFKKRERPAARQFVEYVQSSIATLQGYAPQPPIKQGQTGQSNPHSQFAAPKNSSASQVIVTILLMLLGVASLASVSLVLFWTMSYRETGNPKAPSPISNGIVQEETHSTASATGNDTAVNQSATAPAK